MKKLKNKNTLRYKLLIKRLNCLGKKYLLYGLTIEEYKRYLNLYRVFDYLKWRFIDVVPIHKKTM